MTAIYSHTSAPAHPIHAMLAAYPLAFFSGALVTDILYVNSPQPQWSNFSIWLITFGLIMGGVAAIAGIVDAVLAWGRPRRRSWMHSLGTLLMLALALVNAFVHSRDGWTAIMPTGLILSAIVALLAVATSWIGYSITERKA